MNGRYFTFDRCSHFPRKYLLAYHGMEPKRTKRAGHPLCLKIISYFAGAAKRGFEKIHAPIPAKSSRQVFFRNRVEKCVLLPEYLLAHCKLETEWGQPQLGGRCEKRK